ncbi:GTPase-associated protein 1-related protein [Actinoplanes couchii]|uniref:Uncharacterized protein n=1 Tax=Actinoplanes couchii TaxID=403638 RepID=A0ABQ3WZV3_9ACTN|nr:GTPase-associated protein 1-related protein [Actinoplanes couchii]MDR6316181.1 hypothetical protein [Actinoplanes couchii]GID51796.1 hypothetical protein Aco03nite_002000 [Actinoplanes couchii]
MDGSFETLVYTDCRPGQGLTGGAGLQFQARSSDRAGAAQNLVRDRLLYEPPARWMADRRPADRYPPSFGHLSASGYLATASGLYLGREANGVREGNQLTHTIVTTDPDDYRGLRPAQLYGAAFWTTVPAGTTRCAPVTVSPEDTPWSPGRAKRFVQAQPDGPATLLALVSALDRAGTADGGRILFLGDDPATIVEWLVAGTLLIPRGRALHLGFKIYSNDPARSGAPIVAVHPDFASPATQVGNTLGYLVFDLTTHRHTEVAATPAARRWVGLFLDDDPRDAVDALDVAAESGIADEAAAAALGTAAILHREPPARYAETVVAWLRSGPPLLRDAYGADITDLFADMPERWPRGVLRRLDEAGGDGLLPGKAADVRIALLLKDVEEALTGGRVTAERPGPLPAGEWDPGRDQQVLDLLTEALQAAGRSGAQIEALLRLARRYGAPIHPAGLGEATGALVRYLADDPSRLRRQDWPHGDEIEPLLLAELQGRVLRGGTAPERVGTEWGRWLTARRADLTAELEAAVLGAAVRTAGTSREALIRAELTPLAGDPPAYARRVTALFSQSTPRHDEMLLILEHAPESTPPIDGVFTTVTGRATADAPVSATDLQLSRRLAAQGLIPPDPALDAVLARDAVVTDTLARMRRDPADDLIPGLLEALAGSPPRLVSARLAAVAAALLDLPRFDTAVTSVLEQHPALLDPLLDRLTGALRTETRPELAALGYYLFFGPLRASSNYFEPLATAVDHWLVRVPDRAVEQAGRQLATAGRRWTGRWDERVEALAGRRTRYRLTHPFGGRHT